MTPDTPILSDPHADHTVAAKTPLFFNDLDISLDGKIVFTDSSYRHARSNNRPEILDGAPRGRLFQYDSITQEVSLLLCGLYFPNGVQFLAPTVEYHTTTVYISDTVNEEGIAAPGTTGEHTVEKVVQQEVLVNELTRFRVLKVNTHRALSNAASLTSSCAEDGGLYQALALNAHTDSENYAISGVTMFIPNIPGLVDNVRRDTKLSKHGKEYYLFGLGSKSTAPFSLLWTVLQSNVLREIIGRGIPMKLVEKLVPRYGLILVANEEGELINALHDPTGRVAMLSQASRHPISGDLWLGSHSEPLMILPARAATVKSGLRRKRPRNSPVRRSTAST